LTDTEFGQSVLQSLERETQKGKAYEQTTQQENFMKVYVTSSPKERPDALQRELNRINRELGDSNVSTLPPFLRKLMIH